MRLKYTFKLLILLTALPLSAQIPWSVPDRKASVSDEDYRLAVKIIGETNDAIANDAQNIVYADYWNAAYAYALSQQPPAEVLAFLRKSYELDAETFLELLEGSPKTEARFRAYVGDRALQAVLDSGEPGRTVSATSEEEDDISGYSYLQCTLHAILQRDQRGERTVMDEAQRKIDERNLFLIDSLFAIHRTYIGVDLVGKKLAHTMWAVIQHSNVAAMKRYLPVLRAAIKSGQLPGGNGPLKLTIDRICAHDFGVQIYGSQPGVAVAKRKQADELRLKYPLVQ